MKRILIAAGMIAVAVTAAPALAQAAVPTFDCAKAEHEIELLICKDDDLAAKDRELADVYAQSIAVLQKVADGKEAIATLKTMQRGWIGGRDDCWKADDKRACTSDLYDMRIAELQARYMLVKGGEPVFYDCDDRAEIVATFVPTELPAVRLERGDTTEIGLLKPSASGSRYEADFGVVFRIKGDEAQVEWPQGTGFTCKARK